MDNNTNVKYIVRREIAGYDSSGNPIYREVKIPVSTQQPQTVKRTPQTVRRKKPKRKSPVKRIITIVVLLVILALALYALITITTNYIGFSDSVEEAVGVSSDDIIYTFKVDDEHKITVYSSGDKLCADLLLVNDESYKSIKSCKSIDINDYADDLEGKSMKYTKKDGICFALDYAGSDQYESFEEYIDENATKSFNPGAISVDESSTQIFVLWYWIE
ncbi:MAG: hypothetical protein LIO41_07890 [Ruminococcus sp.]|nr:hypothetical protein [Ruminococcus sp.]